MPDVQMTPGNKDPNRYRGKTIVSAAIITLIAAGAPAIDIFQQFEYENEGSRLTSYKDGESIWTICGGLTRYQGKPVTANMTLTVDECRAADKAAFEFALAAARRIVGEEAWASLSEASKAGLADMVHNLGEGRFAASTAAREIRAGHINDGCAAITLYIRDRNRDCRKAGSNCQGQPIRRMKADFLCLVPKADPS
jgi:lysozyme